MNNYVEEVDVDKVMHGAMHGLADGLDPDSAYLDVNQVKVFEKNEPMGSGTHGLELTRQYYLRVIAARDGSPAARAGLRPGDYIRAIDGQSTRDTSVYEGMRELAGKPGTKVTLTVLRGNAAEPHTLELVREDLPPAPVKGRLAQPGTGYVRIPEFGKATADQLRSEDRRADQGRRVAVVIDLRGTAFGDVETGLAAARLFVPSGTLAFRQERGKPKEPIAAAAGDGSITVPYGAAHRQRHLGCRRTLRRGAHRQQARVDRRRAHAGPRGTSASRATARWQRPAAHASVLPHAGRSRDQREGPHAGCRGRTTRCRVRRAAADHRRDARQSDRAV